MKLRFVYTFLVLTGAAMLWLNNSSGPAEVQGLDRTGGPLSPGPCQSCHSAGAFSPTFTLELLDGGDAVTEYTPGQTYTMRVEINASGSPAGYGFQAVALAGGDDAQAGAFQNPPAGVQVTPLNGRQYAEHSTRSSSNVFELEWQAPESGTGDVRFYAAVVAANGMAGSGGDGSTFLTTPVSLTEGVASSTEDTELLEALSLFPNPASSQLNLQMEAAQPGEYQLQLTNLYGQQFLQQRLFVGRGGQQQSLDVSSLPAGVYSLQLTDGQRVSSRKFVKK